MLKISYWELMEGFSVILDYRAYFLYYVDRGQTNKRDTIALTNMALVERQMNGMTLIPIYDWQIIAGFFQDDYFYLIGSVHVYIFEAKSVQTHLSPIVFMSHLFIVPHADYFYCEHNLLPPNAQHWPANSSSSAEMATVNGTILTTDRSKESVSQKYSCVYISSTCCTLETSPSNSTDHRCDSRHSDCLYRHISVHHILLESVASPPSTITTIRGETKAQRFQDSGQFGWSELK